MAWPLRRYNPRLPLSAQLNIGGPLLSRFDIIILLLDQLSPEVTTSIHCCFWLIAMCSTGGRKWVQPPGVGTAVGLSHSAPLPPIAR